jgi:pimeloyl-ACP methyl ester carboxylesterase
LAYGTGFASNPLADGRAAHFREAEVRLFPGCGHWLHHEARDAFVSVLRGFLAQ